MAMVADVEQIIRRWNEYEVRRGSTPIIDFDFDPCPASASHGNPVDRVTAHRLLSAVRERATTTPSLVTRIDAERAYQRALLGERLELDDYVRLTQGCHARGWSEDYVMYRKDMALERLAELGIPWSAETKCSLHKAEGELEAHDVVPALQDAIREFEPTVRRLAGSAAPFNLVVESIDDGA